MRGCRGAGLLGVTIPQEWGGGGRDYVSYALAIEAIAKASARVAVIVVVNNSLVAELIAQFGTRGADSSSGCRGWRRARRSARSRCPKSTPAPTPPTSRPSRGSTTAAT